MRGVACKSPKQRVSFSSLWRIPSQVLEGTRPAKAGKFLGITEQQMHQNCRVVPVGGLGTEEGRGYLAADGGAVQQLKLWSNPALSQTAYKAALAARKALKDRPSPTNWQPPGYEDAKLPALLQLSGLHQGQAVRNADTCMQLPQRGLYRAPALLLLLLLPRHLLIQPATRGQTPHNCLLRRGDSWGRANIGAALQGVREGFCCCNRCVEEEQHLPGLRASEGQEASRRGRLRANWGAADITGSRNNPGCIVESAVVKKRTNSAPDLRET